MKPLPTAFPSSSPYQPPMSLSRRAVGVLVFACMLALGMLIARAGMQAIGTRHFEVHWQEGEGDTIGPLDLESSETQGVARYDGTDARRIGAGLVSFGAMLFLWGLAGMWSGLTPRQMALPRPTTSALCVVSMALQTAALACIFPPWRWGWGPVLWIAMAFWDAALWVAATDGVDLLRRGRSWKITLGVVGVAAILWAAWHGGDDCWGALLWAVVAGGSYAAHVVLLRLPAINGSRPVTAGTRGPLVG